MLTISDLFRLDDTIAASLFAGKTYPWEVLEGLSAYILQLGATLSPEEFDHPAEDVWIAKDAKVFPSAYLGVLASLTMARRFATARLSGEVRLWGRKLW